MTTATTERLVPAGTWNIDVAHSSATFEAEHAGVSTFRGGFKPIDAKLVSTDDGLELEGIVQVETITVDDENIRPHLLSPDFFYSGGHRVLVDQLLGLLEGVLPVEQRAGTRVGVV